MNILQLHIISTTTTIKFYNYKEKLQIKLNLIEFNLIKIKLIKLNLIKFNLLLIDFKTTHSFFPV